MPESRASRVVRALVAWAVAWLLRGLAATWRIEYLGPDPFERARGEAALGALWHQNVITSATLFRDTGALVPVSQSRDGENITAVMRHLGFGDPPRGSSSRGGSGALSSIVRQLKTGSIVAILVDGPRGPARVPKPGVIAAARISGLPIVPIAMAAHPRLRFGSWDGTELPLPFARVAVVYGEPQTVEKDPDGSLEEGALEDLSLRLEAAHEAALARLDA